MVFNMGLAFMMIELCGSEAASGVNGRYVVGVRWWLELRRGD